MADKGHLFFVFFWGCAGFAVSCFLECLLKPKPPILRPLSAWFCQTGLWFVLFSLALLLLGRPICAAGAVLAIYLVLILVSNAKYASLREPFLYQDYDYFLDVIRFPRLYLPFLGVKSFLLCVLGCLVALGGVLLEKPPTDRWTIQGQAGSILILGAFGCLCLLVSTLKGLKASFRPLPDYMRLGFPAFLYAYFLGCQQKLRIDPPFANLSISCQANLPHLIAIQSESFFDPRRIYPGLPDYVLKNLTIFQGESFIHGALYVPAWGANTVRTEFSFLTGISGEQLAAHQFNPYRAIRPDLGLRGFPACLKAAGYETVCLHPWHASFYGRDRVFPQLGFDRFMDIREFKDCPKSGFYIDDRCLGDKIISLLSRARKQAFIFVITMENHGPLAPEPATDRVGTIPPSCPELPVYIKHLVHADLMLGTLHSALTKLSKPVSLCFYGDHVPIMPHTYAALGYPPEQTPYFCWRNQNAVQSLSRNLPVSSLAHEWLVGSGL